MIHEHWTEEETAALESIESFEEMGDIAIAILSRMSELNRPIVQICGPMSTGGLGDLARNMARFEKAIEVAIEQGVTVFNQMPFQDAMIRLERKLGKTEYCMEILEVFYRRIFTSGYLHRLLFLPDWHTSFGTTWERQFAEQISIVIEEYPQEWWVLIEG